MRRVSHFNLFVFFLLIITGGITYSNAANLSFVHDDHVFIVQNNSKLNFGSAFAAFLPEKSRGLASIENTYYRPILDILYLIQKFFFGLNPVWYHLFNVFIHILNSTLVFILLKSILKQEKVSAVIALIFLVHPVQVESVASIVGISNLLYGFLSLLMLLLYLRHRDDSKISSGYSSAATIAGIYFFTLFVKEQALVVPFLIVLYEVCFHSWRRLSICSKRTLFALGAVTLGYFFWRRIALGAFAGGAAAMPAESFLRLMAIPHSLLDYFRILIFPVGLHYYRSIDFSGISWGPIIIIVLLAGVMGCFFRRLNGEEKRQFVFGFGWFMICILPVLNIIPLIHEYSYMAAFEHFLYLPIIGFFLMIAVGVRHYAGSFLNRKQVMATALASGMVLVLMVVSIRQSIFWRADIPLFERVVKYEKKLARARMLLGKAYYAQGNIASAWQQFTLAEGILSEYLQKVSHPAAREIYQKLLKDVYFDLGHCAEAAGNFQVAISEYLESAALDDQDNHVYNNIGMIYIEKGDIATAQDYFEKALKLEPEDLMAMNNLAFCYLGQNKKGKAKEMLLRVLALDPEYATAKKNLMLIQQLKGEK